MKREASPLEELDYAVRVFISSTFQDMQGERDVLVKRIFPALRSKFRARGIEITEIDLRWGVTQKQSERGETLPILLREIDRCRPFFIAMLGDRYGWVPPDKAYSRDLMRDFPSVESLRGCSVTELEIRYGALSAPQPNAAALFFERVQPDGLAKDGDASRLAALKSDIHGYGANPLRYASIEEFGAAVEQALTSLIDARFPNRELDADERTDRLHRAFARERIRGFTGADAELSALTRWSARDSAPPLLVSGAPGAGKSALLAHWGRWFASQHPGDWMFEHYLGASPEAADPADIARRLWLSLDRAGAAAGPAPADRSALFDALPELFAAAQAALERDGRRAIIVLDGLDKLTDGQELHWWPALSPPRMRVLASAAPGSVSAFAQLRKWEALEVKPLNGQARIEFIEATLSRLGKALELDARRQIAAHAQGGVPLFAGTVLNELRLSGDHEHLGSQLRHLLAAKDLPELFSMVLKRLERDHGKEAVATVAAMLWASHAGLEETEIVSAAKLSPLAWSALRLGFGDMLRDQDGRLTFDQHHLREAVLDRYLNSPASRKRAHQSLADHFSALAKGARRAEELPFQLRSAQAWVPLAALLEDAEELPFLRARGDTELLGHWLSLQAQGVSIERSLCARVLERLSNGAPSAGFEAVAKHVWEFLRFAGARGEHIERLARARLEAGAKSGDPGVTLACKAALALTLFDRGQAMAARVMQEDVVAESAALFGDTSPQHLESRLQLAVFLCAEGSEEAASEFLDTMVDVVTDIPGVKALMWLARLLDRLRGNADLFPGAARSVDELREKVRMGHGAGAGDTVNRARLLYQRFVSRNDNDKLLRAGELQAEVVELSSDQGPASEHLVVASKAALGATLTLMGDFEVAKPLLEEVLEGKVRSLGANHPDALSSMETYVECLCGLRFLDNARELQERVVDARKEMLGPSHPKTVRSMQFLSDILLALDDVEQAAAVKEQALHATANPPGSPPSEARSDAATSADAAMLRAMKRNQKVGQESNLLRAILLILGVVAAAWATYHPDEIQARFERALAWIQGMIH